MEAECSARVLRFVGIAYRPLPSLVVRASFRMPTPEYCFVRSNDFERAYAIKLLIGFAARGLGQIRFEVKLAYIKPKRRKLTDENGFARGGSNSDLRIQGPSVKDGMLKLIDNLKREAAPRY